MVARVLQFDYKSLAQKVKQSNSAAETKQILSEVRAYTPFLDHIVPYLAAIKPERRENGKYNLKDITALLTNTEGFEVFGDFVSSEQLMGILSILGNANRGEYSSIKQGTNSQYSLAVPWFLYAHKLHNHIDYEEWDWNEEYGDNILKAVLGKFLSPIYEYRNYELPDISDLPGIRDVALTVKTTGVKSDEKGNKLSRCGLGEIDELPKPIQYMIFQTWVWHPSIRNKYMITDWSNYDAVKPALQFSSVIAAKQDSSKKLNSLEDLL